MSKIKFNRIVAYGCSYTAGDESTDWDCDVMRYNKYMTVSEIDRLKTSLSLFDFYEKYCPFDFWQRAQIYRKHSYASQLANMFSASIDNRAHSGNSNWSTIVNIENDIVKGNIHSNDLVLIGMTTGHRQFWPDPFEYAKPDGFNHIFSIQPNSKNNFLLKYYDKEFIENIQTFFHPEYYDAMSVLFLNYLVSLHKRLNGKLILVGAASDLKYPYYEIPCIFGKTLEEHPKYIKEPQWNQRWEAAVKNVEGIYVELPNGSMNRNFDKYRQHAGYHPNKNHHKAFAKELYSKLQHRFEVIK